MKHFFLCLCCSLLAAPSWSDSFITTELLFGGASQKASTSGASVSGSDTAYGARVTVDLFPYLAAELAYRDYGEAKDSLVDTQGDTIKDYIQTTAGSLGVTTGRSFGNDAFYFYAGVGLSSWETTYTATDSGAPGQTFKAGDDGVDLYYNLGFQHFMTENIHTGLEYHVLEMSPRVNNSAINHSAKVVSFTLGYHF